MSRPRVLIVCPQPRLRGRAARALSRRYDVVCCEGWLDAERVWQGGFSALVVEEREGLSAKAARLGAPVIVLRSGAGQAGARAPLGDAHVRQGFSAEELVERVEVQLELKRLRDAAATRERALVDEAGDARERLLFLVSATQALTSSLELDDTLNALCAAAVPRLAQWCSITLLEESGPVMKAAWHSQEEKTRLVEELGRRFVVGPRLERRHPVARALAKGATDYVPEVSPQFHERLAGGDPDKLRLLRELGCSGYIAVPLRSGGRAIGVLMLGADETWRRLSPGDVMLAEELAFRAGTAVERARLYQAVQTELSERRRVEGDLRRHEREQNLILDAVNAMIWFKDDANRVLRCNRAAAEWAGRPVHDVEGRRVEELFPAARAKEYYRNDLEVISSGQPRLGVLEEIPQRGGGRRWVRRDTIPYRDERGRVVGVVIFAVDVTEEKKAEDALRASEAAQREFVANVSHEFRTPVAAIKGFAQTLRAGAWKDDAERERFLRIIESNADRLTGLVEDLLTLSALAGGGAARPGACEVRSLALDCAENVLAEARRKRLAVSVSAPRGLRARVGREHLAQILEQLLSNAVRFNRPGGRVALRARRRGGVVELEVGDTGVGIAHEHLPRLFDRFYRVGKGASPGNPGLGLHLVKKLAEAYGGSVTVRSAPGRGSTFRVRLPAARTPRIPRRPRRAAPASPVPARRSSR